VTKRAAHYAPRIGKDICRYIALGKTLAEALKEVGYLAPSMPTFWRWIDEHADFREMYERARTLQADQHADRMLEISREVIDNPRAASAYKVAIDVLRWQAEVRNRSRYGSKADEDTSKKLVEPGKIRAEIKRLETELGIAEKSGAKVSVLKPVKAA
jgi:hypothetical protein